MKHFSDDIQVIWYALGLLVMYRLSSISNDATSSCTFCKFALHYRVQIFKMEIHLDSLVNAAVDYYKSVHWSYHFCQFLTTFSKNALAFERKAY